ncbi:MAG TPA: ADP-forming succinate--CoA ligase subunit beta [Desulfurococcales archaeon]|nr:ADP-forming succinate--CoA ligase subunit beta [Desulfurococcales archaeon]
MELYEFESKRIFMSKGIPVPRGVVIERIEDVNKVTLKPPLMVKAQIPIASRGRLGGIVKVKSLDELKHVVSRLLNTVIGGLKVRKLLIEEAVDIAREYYLSLTIDRVKRKPVILASSEGGVDIEEVARREPWKIIKHYIDPIIGLRDYELRRIAFKIGLRDSSLIREFMSIARAMYNIFTEFECELVESNPLVLTVNGRFVAVDAKIIVDDNALFRHRELELLRRECREYTELELKAREHGFTYVELDGEIGIIGNGAGLTMATMDLVKYYGGNPANFLDIGGGARAEVVKEAVKILLLNPKVKGILVNILGGITRADEVARGVIEALNEVNVRKPIIVRLKGTREEEGRRILSKVGIPLYEDMDEAAKRVVELVKGEGSGARS